MKRPGKTLGVLAVITALLALSMPSLAALTASLDRTQVSLGDSVRLTISTSGDEEISETDLQPLQDQFQVLRRSTSSQTQFVNGRRSHNKQLLVDLAPLVQGTLTIPGLRVGNALTNPLQITVTGAPQPGTSDATVVFESELDRDTVYVQGQVILTLRVMQAVNLESRSVSELDIDGAFTKPLEQKSFQRNIDGKQWLVHELRYAVFPEKSGRLEIPSQVFSGREIAGRRSFFDIGGNGRLIRRVSAPLTLQVLPTPTAFPGSTWLPARSLRIEESWSTPPEQLRVGESATRTLRIVGEGLQGAQLPPILFPSTDSLKYYPDQPVISDEEVRSGLQGLRTDSAALVPTRAGELTLPEIRIPWWDTENNVLRYASLAPRIVQVAPADMTLQPTPAAQDPIDVAAAPTTPHSEVARVWPWQLASAILAAAWLLTLMYYGRMRRVQGHGIIDDDATNKATNNASSERKLFKACLAACKSGDARMARGALIRWGAAQRHDAGIVSLAQVGEAFNDEELTRELAGLDASLYRTPYDTLAPPWSGEALAACLQRVRNLPETGSNADSLALYPQPG